MKGMIPKWMLITLASVWGIAVGIIESGMFAEGTIVYVIASLLSTALAGFAGGKFSTEKRLGNPTTIAAARELSIKTKPPELRL